MEIEALPLYALVYGLPALAVFSMLWWPKSRRPLRWFAAAVVCLCVVLAAPATYCFVSTEPTEPELAGLQVLAYPLLAALAFPCILTAAFGFWGFHLRSRGRAQSPRGEAGPAPSRRART